MSLINLVVIWIVNVVVVIAVVLWLLSAFGVMGGVDDIRIGR